MKVGIVLLGLCLSAIGQTFTPVHFAVVPPPDTNLYALPLIWDKLPSWATNVTIWRTNQLGQVLKTNVGRGTNALMTGLSHTNRYWFRAAAQDTNGKYRTPSSLIVWRPPITNLFNEPTIEASGDLLIWTNFAATNFPLVNPALSKLFFRLRVSVSNDIGGVLEAEK